MPSALKPIAGVLDGAAAAVRRAGAQLVGFAAGYYQRSLGEVALAALPPQLRELDDAQLARRAEAAARRAGAAPAASAAPRRRR